MPTAKRKPPIPQHLRPQIAALKLAIQALTERRRRYYAAAHGGYEAGVRGLSFIEDGERHYQEHSQAIRQLEDLIEILLDPGLEVAQHEPTLELEVERRR